jgi:hypothetical protein
MIDSSRCLLRTNILNSFCLLVLQYFYESGIFMFVLFTVRHSAAHTPVRRVPHPACQGQDIYMSVNPVGEVSEIRFRLDLMLRLWDEGRLSSCYEEA